jgi:hypothetical protein
MVLDAVEALAGDPALVRMMHTVDGVSAVTRLVMTATAKHRKKMVKGLKGLVAKVASDEYGRMVSAAAPVLTSNPQPPRVFAGISDIPYLKVGFLNWAMILEDSPPLEDARNTTSTGGQREWSWGCQGELEDGGPELLSWWCVNR